VDIDAELDRLYKAPAAGFVAERNKLAQALRQGGDREEAERIARLQRPSPVAWAINQLHFRAKKLLDGVREAGAALRKAQESADTEQFGTRKQAHQEALSKATDRALDLAEEAGLGVSATTKRRIEMTLTVLSTAAEEISPPPGRMSAELEPLGFDAFTAMPQAPPKATKRARSPEDAAIAEKLAAVEEALGAAEKECRRLERDAERALAVHERAVRDLEEAEQRAAAARRARDEAATEVKASKSRVDAARRDLERARKTVDSMKN
jgi:hypothetical protein